MSHPMDRGYKWQVSEINLCIVIEQDKGIGHHKFFSNSFKNMFIPRSALLTKQKRLTRAIIKKST